MEERKFVSSHKEVLPAHCRGERGTNPLGWLTYFWRSNGNHNLQLVSMQNKLSSAAEGKKKKPTLKASDVCVLSLVMSSEQ